MWEFCVCFCYVLAPVNTSVNRVPNHTNVHDLITSIYLSITIINDGRIQRGVQTPIENHKWQVTTSFIKITGTDPPPPLEKHFNLGGPMASRGGPYGILRNALMTKKISGSPLIEVSGSVYANILNKSESATPELFAIYIQNYANQECKWKCILMFKYWVMQNSNSYTDVVTRKHTKAI